MQNHKLITYSNITITFTLFIFFLQYMFPIITSYLGLNINFLSVGFWWQPLTVIFTHGGFDHILMNMFMLYIFGNLIESSKGKFTFFLVYFIGGVISSLLTFSFMYIFEINLFDGGGVVGASGAICGILGYIAFIDRYQRKGMVIWVLLISLAPLVLGLPIAWYGHLLGFVVGWIIGMIKK